jgi:hypothetical protein
VETASGVADALDQLADKAERLRPPCDERRIAEPFSRIV